ncbi:MAG TPA: aspartate 1-decarboxylase [candidate division WOR-3 bacterium]|uniref:Aspartate 1-decarboxylase n=1 Tax=candidate division WOR-3 bacterium TaxID=2052148 RepID=A0A7V5HQF5_UNCW3|nr:aspartate 1-decarboxylase [candidate division WOR-3 bacterium]
MMVTLLKSKIHRIPVTGKEMNYEGSITIDIDIMKKVDLLPYERVEVYNITNGERFSTYVIPGKQGSGEVILNGATARKGEVGDLLIVVSYITLDVEEAKNYKPKVYIFGKHIQ